MLFNHRGPEFLDDPRLNFLHRWYIRIFGIPVSGLRIRLRRILPAIEGRFQSLVDLGCGKGVFTFELARRYPNSRVLGIDNDQTQVDINNHIAKKHGLKNLTFEVQDILEFKTAEKFDLALSVDNLEHIKDDRAALKNILECLKPGGTFVCHVPAKERVWIFWGYSTNFDVPGHVRPGYRLIEIKDKIEETGFHILESRHTYGYLETVTNNLSYLITGADQRNKLFYALAFPVLNFVAWLGAAQDPKGRGAGVLTISHRPAKP